MLKEIYDDIDNFGYISKKTGKELKKLLENPNYNLGIHSAGIQRANSIIESGGLRLTGDISSGVVNNIVYLENNISFYNKEDMDSLSLFYLIRELKVAYSYKSIGKKADVLLIAIPIDKEESELIEIKDGFPVLNSKYIYGYVTSDHGNVSEIVHNQSFMELEKHKK